MGENQAQPFPLSVNKLFHIEFQEPPALSDSARRRQVILQATFLVLVVAAAFVLRIWGLSKNRFWDETVYLQNAEVICCGKTNYSELDSRPPLLSLIFAGVYLLWHHIYAASIITALINALGVAFLYLSGRMIAGRIPAAIAALLLAFSPFMAGHGAGNSLLTDCPALTLILFSFWLLLRAIRNPTSLRFAYVGFAFALAVLMRFPSLASVGMLSLLIFAADRWWKAALACAAGFAAGIVPYLCWSRYAYGGFFATFVGGWQNVGGTGESHLYYFKNFADIFSWITLAGLALWIVQWTWEMWKRRAEDHPAAETERTEGRHSRALEGFLWLWAVVLLLFFTALSHREERYAMPLAPPLFLLAGIGLSALMKPRRTIIRIGGTALLAAALAYTFLPAFQVFASPFIDTETSEEMDVSDFLIHNVPQDTLLYANENYPVFAYYTNFNLDILPESGPPLYDALNHLDADGIFIAYKDLDGEIVEPHIDWLDANPHFTQFQSFTSIVLYKFHANPGR
jgi:4-amino-4-deoxy-L-arabinose transferase-like glycosyltransferase